MYKIIFPHIKPQIEARDMAQCAATCFSYFMDNWFLNLERELARKAYFDCFLYKLNYQDTWECVVRPKKTGRAQMEWVYWQEQQSHNFYASEAALWCFIQMAPNLQWIHISNPSSHSRDMSQQKFVKILHFFLLCHFVHFAKIAITRVCVLRSGWNLAHILGV